MKNDLDVVLAEQPISKCAHCEAAFSKRSLAHKYCTSACCDQARYLRLRQTDGPGKGWAGGKEYVARRVCLVCGKKFYAPPVLMRRGGGKFCSNECRGAHVAANPRLYPHTQSRRGKGGIRTDLGRYFRSSWEANWARYLNWLISIGEIKAWDFEPDTFQFHSIKRGSRFYTPDFKVTNNDGSIEYHEVKGYMDQKSATKLRRMAKYYPEIKIVLVDKAFYRSVASKISTMIPGWESVRGKPCRTD